MNVFDFSNSVCTRHFIAVPRTVTDMQSHLPLVATAFLKPLYSGVIDRQKDVHVLCMQPDEFGGEPVNPVTIYVINKPSPGKSPPALLLTVVIFLV